MFQWGTYTSGGSKTITFPQTFKKALYLNRINLNSSSGNTYARVQGYQELTTSTAKLYCEQSGYWCAFGTC